MPVEVNQNWNLVVAEAVRVAVKMNSKRCHRGVGQNEAFSPQFDQSRGHHCQVGHHISAI